MTLPSTLIDQNSAPDLDYRFSEIEITLSWFPSHSFKLFLIDGLLNRLLSFCLYHLDSSFLVLLTIILTAPLGAWHRFDLLFAMELHCVIWPWKVSASDKVAALHMQICFAKLPNRKKWSSFSIIIRINKGEDWVSQKKPPESIKRRSLLKCFVRPQGRGGGTPIHCL